MICRHHFNDLALHFLVDVPRVPPPLRFSRGRSGVGLGIWCEGTARGFAHCFKVPDVIISVMKTIWLALSGVLKLS